MDAVMAAERRLGNRPEDVSALNRGWDIESRRPDGRPMRLIEVKGRHADARTVTLTRNELLSARNKPEDYLLAIVRVDLGYAGAPAYIRGFATRPLDFWECTVTMEIDKLLRLAEREDMTSATHA